MMNWLQKMFYTLSGHKEARKPLDVPTALQAMLEKGISIGKHDAQPVIIEKRVCRKHEMVLLVEIEIGHYICTMCEEEKHTGPIRAQHTMMNLYNAARKQGAGPQTAVQMITPKLTRNLKEWKQEQEQAHN